MKSVQLSPEHFKDKSLMIATPCYGGALCYEYVLSIYKLSTLLSSFGIKHELNLMANESLITRARNHLIAQFMTSNKTHIIFIDADTDFDEKDVLKFLYCDKDILCGAVPLKTLPTVYNSYINTNDNEEIKRDDDFFIELDTIGAAFMMIKKNVIKKMFNAYPKLKYKPSESFAKALSSTTKEKEEIQDNCYALFDTSIETHKDHFEGQDSGYWAEDFTFVKRWQELGGKILLNPDVKLNHVGRYNYKGDLSKIL